MRFNDVIMALLVIVIILMIIIPVPLGWLDFFLALNISLALTILVLSMFVKETLEFSVFPSILLITTLFRLALNISTTRYILSDGKAGEVIDAFGNFVVGGNAIVGFIIFLIIVLIQFLVITKGSERVSEVAARFTLDAMPGKQMAIDADLNSGLITENDAKERRKKIQREADFYGAMDGASKFVKGDAIAGIIITVINILAGFMLGAFTMGYTLSQSIQKFTLLTVGDGLVSQIPALMISVATGIIVTRAASESNLGTDVLSQLFAQSKVLYIVGGVLMLIGIATPLPNLPFITIGIAIMLSALRLTQDKKELEEQAEFESEQEEERDNNDIRKPENIIPLLQVDPIELEFGYGIIPLADPNQGGDLFDRLVMIRRQIALEMGIVVPMIRLRDNIQLDSSEYLIKIKGNDIARGTIVFDHYLAMSPGVVEGEIEGIDTIEPAFGLPAKWIRSEDREKAELLGYTVVDPSSVISTHLTEVIKKHSHELINREDVKQLIENIKESNSALVEELMPNLMSLGDIQKVLSNLLKEFVSVRDLVTILETLADYARSTRDVNILTEYVRQRLSRQLSRTYFPFGKAKVVTLEQSLENMLMEAIEQNENGTFLSIDPMTSQNIVASLAQEVRKLIQMGEQAIVVTAPIVRFYFKRMTEQSIPELVVLSYNEIESDIDIQSAGMVSI
ncbi:flagellar biosynthesis protein FlhA [Fusibacter ferrireducens]|uniref:Flagellar biosynthesis protein FlhA n=1 Tax=Fusibacter ferrireducens TaxID=2785058 RepID=A0ABR9ZQ28_9FIRM|nr:flagellar biosynthesis protein FlhA [Fusibacter ferrireducens]MBF4691744.1 flagellar biosynthesis protein FlhA [Fusibacter ferrireducens]